MQNNIENQIEKELKRKNINKSHVFGVKKLGDTGLIIFDVNAREYWATLTPTGKLKKNSIRINNF